jgi:hypothetical protein
MVKNLGTPDKIVRLIIASAILILLFTVQLSTVAAILLGIAAGLLIITSLTGTCLVYLPFGISTRNKKAGLN